jgi:hypothetical protein
MSLFLISSNEWVFEFYKRNKLNLDLTIMRARLKIQIWVDFTFSSVFLIKSVDWDVNSYNALLRKKITNFKEPRATSSAWLRKGSGLFMSWFTLRLPMISGNLYYPEIETMNCLITKSASAITHSSRKRPSSTNETRLFIHRIDWP